MIDTTHTTLEVMDSPDADALSFAKNVLHDYWLCLISREASLMGRKEVLNGKAKFGILGDGKEVPQVAMARAFKKGDWRSGYYRDQTLMIARGLCTIEDYFAQLYADNENDPFSGGRQMNSHYATPMVDKNGIWMEQTRMYNVSSDISCTAGQMARSLGLAMASKKYRKLDIPGSERFSSNGNEVSFVTIGDSSTSEGVFWETVNAAAVMRVPLVIAVWDDGYGISVPVEMQTAKGSISKAMKGLEYDGGDNGIVIYKVRGWDYADVCTTFEKAALHAREHHIPILIHVTELTQPQGHSTSGSHERYKSPERLQWEKDYDCIKKMKEWILENGLSSEEELEKLEEEAVSYVKKAKEAAWTNYVQKINDYRHKINAILQRIALEYKTSTIAKLEGELNSNQHLVFSEIVQIARKIKHQLGRFNGINTTELTDALDEAYRMAHQRFHTHLYSESPRSALNVPVVKPYFGLEPKVRNGYQVLNEYFDALLSSRAEVLAFGEDVGQIGDVNQGFAGMQAKHGSERVFDTGIREWTIIGQAIGASMRGLRPIAEIQYLDYMAYAFSALTDDLATLRYRSNGIQCAPAIIRSRGHRLEGVWHAGSPMGMIITSMKGIYLCVPRDMTRAIGFYNTLLSSDDPGIIVECLNGYRLKEHLPENLLEFTLPLGVPEILEEGSDVTLVTYGSCVRIAQSAIDVLKGYGISVELIDVQTLMPFDLEGLIVSSLKKTSRILFLDEDVPGGATSFMLTEVIDRWEGFKYLDPAPKILCAHAHRTPFGSDGDYFTKPNVEDVVEAILDLVSA